MDEIVDLSRYPLDPDAPGDGKDTDRRCSPEIPEFLVPTAWAGTA